MSRRLSRLRFLSALGAAGSPVICRLPSSAAGAETYTLRLSMGQGSGPTSTQGVTAARFATAVQRRSKGQLKIEVYPNGQLLRQDQIVDALSTGVVDFVIELTVLLEPLIPQYQILAIPFMFKDLASAFRVLDGRIGDEFFGLLEPHGILGLGDHNRLSGSRDGDQGRLGAGRYERAAHAHPGQCGLRCNVPSPWRNAGSDRFSRDVRCSSAAYD
jgi:TRAP-type C4-dicarboxylate transport system substrate-binding protein